MARVYSVVHTRRIIYVVFVNLYLLHSYYFLVCIMLISHSLYGYPTLLLYAKSRFGIPIDVWILQVISKSRQFTRAPLHGARFVIGAVLIDK